MNKENNTCLTNSKGKGFIGLALGNEELLKSNHQLKQHLKELTTIKQEREEKAARKERKRFPKGDPITGSRINELLPLKVYQLQTLVEEGWIAIDRSKRGPASHKAFLTKEGKKLLKERPFENINP